MKKKSVAVLLSLVLMIYSIPFCFSEEAIEDIDPVIEEAVSESEEASEEDDSEPTEIAPAVSSEIADATDDTVEDATDDAANDGSEEDDATDGDPETEEEPLCSGSCGNNVVWNLYSDGVLKISGTGAMAEGDWVWANEWRQLRSQATEIVIEDGVTSTAYGALNGFELVTSITVADTVTSMGNYTFCGCSALTDLKLSSGLSELPYSAFNDCNWLKEVTLPEGMTKIGESAFRCCSYLKKVTLPASLKEIGKEAFYKCERLSDINFPENLERIDVGAFFNCLALEKANLPASMTYLGSSAFKKCSGLKEVSIPDGITDILGSTFYSCTSLSKVTLGNQIVNIGTYAFCGCPFTSIKFPETLLNIKAHAFAECSQLVEIEFPENLLSIGDRAFYRCEQVTEVYLPDSLQSLGTEAFLYCLALKDIFIPNTITSYGNSILQGCLNIELALVGYDTPIFWYCLENDIPCYPYDVDTLEVTKRGTKNGTQTVEYGSRTLLLPTFEDTEEWYIKSFTSSNKKVAKVDSYGCITAANEGTATITMTSSNKKKTTVIIKVVDKTKPTKVTADVSGTVALKMDDDPTYTVHASVLPENAICTYKVSSSDKTTATVTVDAQTGKITITPIGEGTATITVTAVHGSLTKKTSFKVKVTDPYKPSSIKMKGTSKIMAPGTDYAVQTLSVVSNEGAKIDRVVWKSSAPKVASIDANGVLTANKKGTTSISATAIRGKYKKTVTVKITVVDPKSPTGVNVTLPKEYIDIGEKETATAEVVCIDPTGDYKITWSSSNSKIAKVDSKTGVITGVKYGTAKITATVTYGKVKKSKTVSVKVYNPYVTTAISITGPDVSKGVLTLHPLQNSVVYVKIAPDTARQTANLRYTLTGSAVYMKQGNLGASIYALTGTGTCTLTVKEVNTGLKASIKIVVKK